MFQGAAAIQDEIWAKELGERLRTAQRIAKLGFWDWNIQTGALFWSQEIFTIFGLDPYSFEATYDAFLQVVHPDDRQRLQDAVTAAVNDKADYKIEHRIVRPDGEILHVSEQGAVSYNSTGEPLHMLGTVMDITKLKEAEISRIQIEEEFRNLWEANFHSMITIDTENIVTRVNNAAEAMFGYPRNELLGENINLLVPESLRAAHSEHQRQYRKNPYRRIMGNGLELEAQCKNGDVIPVEISLTPFEYMGRKEILVQIHDISERKTLETRLGQSRKLESLGRSVSGLAHDLNNLLAVMYNSIELSSLQFPQNEASDPNLERALLAGERARNIIDQMLAFTRQQNLQPRLIDVNQVIRDFEKILQPLLPQHIELHLALDSNFGRARLDPEKFEQIIMNLVVNARDAIGEAGRITIETATCEARSLQENVELTDPAKNYLQVSVTDTGSGISATELSNIFEPFYTTKQPGQGTGLGLSSVYGLVKQSNGEIIVQSEPGKGSSFHLYFPVVDTQSDSPA